MGLRFIDFLSEELLEGMVIFTILFLTLFFIKSLEEEIWNIPFYRSFFLIYLLYLKQIDIIEITKMKITEDFRLKHSQDMICCKRGFIKNLTNHSPPFS